jgi:hypothetical protein
MEDENLSEPDIIIIPLVTRTEYDGQGNDKKKKKREEVQDIDSEDQDNASEETASDSPAGKEGGDEVNKEDQGEEDKQEKGEVTMPKGPLIEAETSKKRKVSPKKPSAWKKSRASNQSSQNVLIVVDIDLIIPAVVDASDDFL